jgi:DnaJ family protein B protein 4
MTNNQIDLYDILNINKNASSSEIKKAYRKLAQLFHPDRNKTDEAIEKMKQINMAYEILKDDKKKSIYDQYGLEAVLNYGQDGDINDFSQSVFQNFFDMSSGHPFFGGNSRVFINGQEMRGGHPFDNFFNQRRKPKTEDMMITIDLTLDELYNGVKKIITINRLVSSKKNGKLTKKTETENLEIKIKPGLKNNQPIKLKNKSHKHFDEAYGDAIQGDVILIVDQKPHSIFKRQDEHLIVDIDLSLTELLCGFQKQIIHLDDRKLNIVNNNILKPPFTKLISNEGMPKYGSSLKGHLIINFNLQFPNKLSSEQKKEIAKLFNYQLPTKSIKPNVTLKDYTGNVKTNNDSDSDSDYEFNNGGQPNCRTM